MCAKYAHMHVHVNQFFSLQKLALSSGNKCVSISIQVNCGHMMILASTDDESEELEIIIEDSSDNEDAGDKQYINTSTSIKKLIGVQLILSSCFANHVILFF